MRFLVTGGAGFIGSHIVDALVDSGDKVTVLDNFVTGKEENLSKSLNKIKLVRGDIRKEKDLIPAVRGADFILHQAALRSVPRSIDDPVSSNDVNVSGTLLLLKTASSEKVKRVIFASSSSVYGDSREIPQKESQLPAPVSPYAASKAAGEYYCRVFAKIYGLETVSLRYFNVFGPRQDPRSNYAAVIPKFIRLAIHGIPFEIHGDGRQSRDFSYITNVVNANILAATARNVSGEVFNVACGESHSVLDIARAITRTLKIRQKYDFLPSRKGDVKVTLADISKAKRQLKYRASIDFDAGMNLTIKYFLKKPSEAK
jgi:UDP-glucose 4-epimerase